jgi:hypothetical protein
MCDNLGIGLLFEQILHGLPLLVFGGQAITMFI